MSATIWLVIPTYNERENLAKIVDAAGAELERAAPGDFRILIVDDNSPDGTGPIADGLAEAHDWLEVLHRPRKSGLGQAYLAGFTRAMECGARLLVEMDADFSHDPRYLPELIAAADHADLVLGSRYVAGGGVRDWGLIRRLISRGGGIYARRILGVDVRDLTGGFKCIRREVLEAIDLPSVRAEGYVFQIEVTYRAILAGFTVEEVPIVFSDRTSGRSKMSSTIALEAMLQVPVMKRNAPAALARAKAARPPATPAKID
jgi:dolichol-phosphate mannosyltransferase